MNVVVEQTGPCRKKLRIEMPVERVDTEFNSVLSEYTRMARIPGFRPGHAPHALVKKRFGREIEKEVKDRLIPAGYREAVDREKLSPLAVLEVNDRSFIIGQPFAFEITLDVLPEFTLPAYRGLALKARPVDVGTDEVEKAIQNIRESSARFEEVTGRAAARGDLVQVDYEGFCDNRPIRELVKNAPGLGEGKDFWVQADDHAFLPEFGRELPGTEAGQHKQIPVDFAADFQVAELAGKQATYFVTVKAVRARRIPELDAGFLKDLGMESAEELRKKIGEDLGRVAQERENNRLKSEIIKGLLEQTRMDLPSSVVAEETRNTIHDLVRENTARGVSREQIEDKKEELLNAASRTAEEKVKAQYLIHRIADEEKIQATEDDLNGRLESMGRSYGLPAVEVRSQVEKNNRLDVLRDQIRFNKTLDFLLEQARVER